MAGPKADVKEAWRLIRGPNPRAWEKGIVLDDPTPAGKFLGCNQVSYVWAPPMRADRESVQPLMGNEGSDIAERVQRPTATTGVQYSEAWCDDIRETNKTHENDADLIQPPLDETTKERDEQPLEGKLSDNVHATVDEQPECLPTSGERDPSAGNVCCKQIKCDVSDFLGSCVRLRGSRKFA
jgi:hypothetical protein